MTNNDDLLSTVKRHVEESATNGLRAEGPRGAVESGGQRHILAETTLSALEANLKRFQKQKDWFERRELQKD